MKLKISDAILSIAPYVPGKPMAALERELGIANAIKLASNENPIGPSPLAMVALQGVMQEYLLLFLRTLPAYCHHHRLRFL